MNSVQSEKYNSRNGIQSLRSLLLTSGINKLILLLIKPLRKWFWNWIKVNLVCMEVRCNFVPMYFVTLGLKLNLYARHRSMLSVFQSVVLQLHANCTWKCILVWSPVFCYLFKYMVENYFRVLLEKKESMIIVVILMMYQIFITQLTFFRIVDDCSARLAYLLLAYSREWQ